ncbi:hypothetical protein ACWC9R_12520 [Streptomyces sp. NPDC001219]
MPSTVNTSRATPAAVVAPRWCAPEEFPNSVFSVQVPTFRDNSSAYVCESFMLTDMHPRDEEMWRAIDQGLRAIDWEAWFGCPEGAEYLSPAGHEVTARAVAGLTAFFDSRWLPKAVTPSTTSGRASDTFVGLGRAAPVLQFMNGADRGAWVEAVRWWAAYAYLEEAGVPGLASVKRDARRDVTLSRFLHTQTQARLALMGAARGLPVELEPAKDSGGPGDVRIGRVFIEVVTFAEDQKLQDYEKFRQNCRVHLVTLDRDRTIYWEGDFPELLNGNDFETWKKRTEEAAQQCAASGVAVDVLSSARRRLTVHPGTTPLGTTLTGDTVESDQGTRLLGKVRGKCAKTRSGHRVDLGGGPQRPLPPPDALRRAVARRQDRRTRRTVRAAPGGVRPRRRDHRLECGPPTPAAPAGRGRDPPRGAGLPAGAAPRPGPRDDCDPAKDPSA